MNIHRKVCIDGWDVHRWAFLFISPRIHQFLVVLGQNCLFARAHFIFDGLRDFLGELKCLFKVNLLILRLLQDDFHVNWRSRALSIFFLLWFDHLETSLFFFLLLLQLLPCVGPVDGLLLDQFELCDLTLLLLREVGFNLQQLLVHLVLSWRFLVNGSVSEWDLFLRANRIHVFGS